MTMSIQKKALRDSALISATTIILAGVVLLSLRVMLPVSSYQLQALQLSLGLGVGACFTLFARRMGQAHIAWGAYLLATGGAAVVLPRLLLTDYGQSDTDLLLLFLGPLYLFIGSILVVISLINHRHWMESVKTMWVRTLLLAGPGALLTILCPIALGPRMWDVSPFGFDLVVASWIVGIGIFFAGSRFVKTVKPDAHQETFSSSTQ